jgi:sugar/nucleoside kinase (ribokinase family)
MATFDIITVGHFSIDFIISKDGSKSNPVLGGPPTYVSLAALNFGMKVSVMSKVGKDFSSESIDWLREKGLNLSFLQVVEDALTTSFILDCQIDHERQLILKNRAPSIRLCDIPESLEAKILQVSPIANEISQEVLSDLKEKSDLISLDPQGFIRSFDDNGRTQLGKMKNLEILKGIEVFKASQMEMKAATGKSKIARAIDIIRDKGVEVIIVTKGKEGTLLSFKGRMYQVPAAKPRLVVDDTGAGDVFIGAFLAEYLRGKDPLWCTSIGSAAASFIIEEFGPKGFASEKKVHERANQVFENACTISRA